MRNWAGQEFEPPWCFRGITDCCRWASHVKPSLCYALEMNGRWGQQLMYTGTHMATSNHCTLCMYDNMSIKLNIPVISSTNYGICGINGQNRMCTQNWTENNLVTSKPINKVFSYDVCPMLSSENFNIQIVQRCS